MVWFWIIVAIVVVLLLVWLYMSMRNRQATTGGSGAGSTQYSTDTGASTRAPTVGSDRLAGESESPIWPTTAEAGGGESDESTPGYTTGTPAEAAAPAGADTAAVDDTAAPPLEDTAEPVDDTTPSIDDTAATAAIADGAFGPGSADPADDGSGPAGYDVKGNADSMLYHTTESPDYVRTRAEVWFNSEDTARAAGFKRWDE